MNTFHCCSFGSCHHPGHASKSVADDNVDAKKIQAASWTYDHDMYEEIFEVDIFSKDFKETQKRRELGRLCNGLKVRNHARVGPSSTGSSGVHNLMNDLNGTTGICPGCEASDHRMVTTVRLQEKSGI